MDALKDTISNNSVLFRLESIQHGSISGWLVKTDRVAGTEVPTISLYQDDHLISRKEISIPRPDVEVSLNIPGSHGFSITADPEKINRIGANLRLVYEETGESIEIIKGLPPHRFLPADSGIPTIKYHIDSVSSTGISGWIFDETGFSLHDRFYAVIDGERIGPVSFHVRKDLNEKFFLHGTHGFTIEIPDFYFDGLGHFVALMVDKNGKANEINNFFQIFPRYNYSFEESINFIRSSQKKADLPFLDYISDSCSELSIEQKWEIETIFQAGYYKRTYPGILLPPLAHYLREGSNLLYNPSPLFDEALYQKRHNPEKLPGFVGLIHYVKNRTEKEISLTHPLIDDAFILEQNSGNTEVATNLGLLANISEQNGESITDPCRIFDSSYYLKTYFALVARPPNPLIHFLERGYLLNYSPNPFFDLVFYRHCKSLKQNVNPLLDFVSERVSERRNPNILIDYLHCLRSFPIKPNTKADKVYEDPLEFLTRSNKSLSSFTSGHCREIWQNCHQSRLVGLYRGKGTRRRVIIFSHNASRTGAPLIILRIAQTLTENFNIECINVLAEPGVLLEDFRSVGPTVILSEFQKHGWFSNSALNTLVYNLCDTKPSFALCNTANSAFFSAALANFNIPVFTLCHEMARPYPNFHLERIFSSSVSVIVPSQAVRESYTHSNPHFDSQIDVIGQGLLRPDFPSGNRELARSTLRQKLDLPEDAFICLGCGSIDQRKGVDFFTILARFVHLKYSTENIFFLWLGKGLDADGQPAYWFTLDRELAQLEGTLFIQGERKDPSEFFLAADAFLMVSRQDPYPCVVHEAMASALPIIAFENAGGAPEAYGDSGITVPYLDIESTARAIMRVKTDAHLRTSIRQKNKTVVSNDFNYDNYVKNLLETVDSRLKTDHDILDESIKFPKIIFPCSDWNISGVNSITEMLAQRLAADGNSVELLFTHSENLADRHHLPVDIPYKILENDGYNLQKRWEQISDYLEEQGRCILFTTYDHITASLIPALSDSIAVIGVSHSDDTEYYEQYLRLGRYWNAHICVSQLILDHCKKLNPLEFLDQRAIATGVPEIFTAGFAQRRFDPEKNNIDLVYVGRLVKFQKRLDRFIDLVDLLDRANISFSLRFIGDGDYKPTLMNRLESHIKKGRIIFLGKLSKTEIVTQLVESDAFLLLSDFEGLPVCLLEAMATGCVPIVTPIESGVSEIVCDQYNGLRSDTFEPLSIFKEIQNLAEDRDLLYRLSENAHKTIEQRNLTETAMYESYKEVINSVKASMVSYQRPIPVSKSKAFGHIVISPIISQHPDY